MDFKQIKTVKELKNLFINQTCVGEFFVQLSCGARSWKQIFYDSEHDVYFITNEIDESEDTYDSTESFMKSFFYNTYMEKGALYFAWF